MDGILRLFLFVGTLFAFFLAAVGYQALARYRRKRVRRIAMTGTALAAAPDEPAPAPDAAAPPRPEGLAALDIRPEELPLASDDPRLQRALSDPRVRDLLLGFGLSTGGTGPDPVIEPGESG